MNISDPSMRFTVDRLDKELIPLSIFEADSQCNSSFRFTLAT